MNRRAALPPGLPRPSPTVSYWQTPPSPLSTHRTPHLPPQITTIIIGAGLTGTLLALNLLTLHPAATVVLLEARTACSGATGRTGGSTKSAAYRSFAEQVQTVGEEEAAKMARLAYRGMKELHGFVRETGIGCDGWEGKTVDVVLDEGEWKRAKMGVREMQRVLGKEDPAAQYEFHDSVETEERFLVKGAVGSVTYDAGSLSAYHLACGVLALALEKGLNLQTETPVTGLGRGRNGRWNVKTSRGDLQAENVVLCTNGYTAQLYTPLQGVVVPVRSHVMAQRPGNNMPPNGLQTTYSFIYAGGFDYLTPRPRGSGYAGDIIVGGGLTKAYHKGEYEIGTPDDSMIDPVIFSYLRQSTKAFFGANWGDDDPRGHVRQGWSGIMGYSADGFPFVGELPDEEKLYIAAAFQGHGMVLCFLAAKALTEIMSGGDEKQLDEWFPTSFRPTKERMKLEFKGIADIRNSKDLRPSRHKRSLSRVS